MKQYATFKTLKFSSFHSPSDFIMPISVDHRVKQKQSNSLPRKKNGSPRSLQINVCERTRLIFPFIIPLNDILKQTRINYNHHIKNSDPWTMDYMILFISKYHKQADESYRTL